jgi:L-lysine 6-transaminase
MMNTVINYTPKYYVAPDDVIDELKKYMLVDGFNLVLDLEHSHDYEIVDARGTQTFKDFFTCFASMPVGFNHPKITDSAFVEYIGRMALNKPSNSDIYTEAMATFVKTFFKVAVPEWFKYSFFISGGALAVENALKASFDWKVRKNFAKGLKVEKGHKVIHFREAFHGRSGYTMSLTNTDPVKVMYYPKFDWPKIDNPKMIFPITDDNIEDLISRENNSIEQAKRAFLDNKDEIACIIIEPIQGEGGDNHFRPRFLQELRQLADENECLLVFDEVQTGLGITGSYWAHEQLGVIPDIMSFGKKMQICGILAGEKLDEVPDNVFHTSSRINSTWGGNLVDMIRSTKYLEIMEDENILSNVRNMGDELKDHLLELRNEFPGIISNVRGRGLFCAFDLNDQATRNKFRENCFKDGMIILPCGEKSMRFRPPLNITSEQLDIGVKIIRKAIEDL